MGLCHMRQVAEDGVSRRVKPHVVRRRLLALLERARTETDGDAIRSAEWWSGFTAGIHIANDVIRKG